jgi:hypothetical protein
MFAKLLRCSFALTVLLLLASCDRSNDSRTPVPTPTIQPGIELRDYLRQPGKITHIRYTSYTPPWPTRTEAWIDWENDRTRAWMVQWTDSPTNPSICTSIRSGDEWHPCLPSDFTVEAPDFGRVYGIYPQVPLLASDTELSLPFPQGFFGDPGAAALPVQIADGPTTKRQRHGDEMLVVSSWKISSDLELPCHEEGQHAANFEYTSTEEGEPISEFITVACGEESGPYFGVQYHEIEFVEPSELPPDFFDVDATRRELLEDQLSSAAAQLGRVFWLGERVNEWSLVGAEHDDRSASVGYSRPGTDEEDTIVLTTRAQGSGYLCPDAEPLPAGGSHDGNLCTTDEFGGLYRVVWSVPGFDLWLEVESYPPRVSRDEVIALAMKLLEWEQEASGPLLTDHAVRDLVADSLELVCPGKRIEIRKAREASTFGFDRGTGEWTGSFGEFGEIAVPDSKPVAIPVNNREEVESTLSHNAAQFADCVADEQPPPQEGDDEFGVTFIESDESRFEFEITGVDSETEAALSFCIFDSERCVLTNPDGTRFGARGAEINDVRPNVVRIDVTLGEGQASRTGQWTFALDLGEGRTTEVSFEVR